MRNLRTPPDLEETHFSLSAHHIIPVLRMGTLRGSGTFITVQDELRIPSLGLWWYTLGPRGPLWARPGSDVSLRIEWAPGWDPLSLRAQLVPLGLGVLFVRGTDDSHLCANAPAKTGLWTLVTRVGYSWPSAARSLPEPIRLIFYHAKMWIIVT